MCSLGQSLTHLTVESFGSDEPTIPEALRSETTAGSLLHQALGAVLSILQDKTLHVRIVKKALFTPF